MANELVVATQDVTLHRSNGELELGDGRKTEDVSAFVLPAGKSVPLSSLAKYQQEQLKSEEGVAGLRVVSESEAKKLAEDAAGGNVDPTVAMTAGHVALGPDVSESGVGSDPSFSDHQVADDERVANHVARAKEEAGEAGNDDEKVTVPGAEDETSPATAGRHTRADSGDQVQGSSGADTAVAKKSESKSK